MESSCVRPNPSSLSDWFGSLKHVHSICMVTHSQGRQIVAAEESMGILTIETLTERPGLGDHPEIRETADLVLMKNPNTVNP